MSTTIWDDAGPTSERRGAASTKLAVGEAVVAGRFASPSRLPEAIVSEAADPTEFVRSSMPLCAELGVTASEATPDRVVLQMDWRAELCTIGGVLHGGTLMSLADSSGAVCAFLNLPDDAVATSTIESKTNFFGAVSDGMSVQAVSRPLHAGSTTIVVETELHVGDRLVAKTIQTQAVLRPR